MLPDATVEANTSFFAITAERIRVWARGVPVVFEDWRDGELVEVCAMGESGNGVGETTGIGDSNSRSKFEVGLVWISRLALGGTIEVRRGKGFEWLMDPSLCSE